MIIRNLQIRNGNIQRENNLFRFIQYGNGRFRVLIIFNSEVIIFYYCFVVVIFYVIIVFELNLDLCVVMDLWLRMVVFMVNYFILMVLEIDRLSFNL